MDKVKSFFKYGIIIAFLNFLTFFCAYVGFNSTYKNIDNIGNIPSEVKIELAQATSVNGRIYGKITNSKENDLNGKYIKTQIFNKQDSLMGTKFIKIENLGEEEKKFAVNFKTEGVKKYNIEIVDDNSYVQEEVIRSIKLYGKVFTKEELKTYAIILLIFYAMFA